MYRKFKDFAKSLAAVLLPAEACPSIAIIIVLLSRIDFIF